MATAGPVNVNVALKRGNATQKVRAAQKQASSGGVLHFEDMVGEHHLMNPITFREPVAIKLGATTFYLHGPVRFEDEYFHVAGVGPLTKFVAMGPPDMAMFELASVGPNSYFGDFQLAANAAQPAKEAIRLTNAGGNTVPSSRVLERITINGTNGGFRHGVHWDPTDGGGEGNNDVDTLRNVLVYNCAEGGAAFMIEGSQSVHHYFERCQASSWAPAGKAVGLQVGSDRFAGGNFHWFGGSMNYNKVDFRLHNAGAGAYTVEKVDGENSERILEVTNPWDAPIHVTIKSTRFASGTMPDTPDGRKIIRYAAGGSLILESNLLAPNRPGSWCVSLESAYVKGEATGNTIVSTLEDPFVPKDSWFRKGNNIATPELAVKHLVEWGQDARFLKKA